MGKHFLPCFDPPDSDNFTLRVHLLLWGSYRIDERREGRAERLSLALPETVWMTFIFSSRPNVSAVILAPPLHWRMPCAPYSSAAP